MTDPTGRVFDALADPNRRYVVEALAERETATATELAAELPVTRQAVAKHLAALNEAGLVESRPALGAGDDAVQLVQQISRLRDRVGPPSDVAAERAVDGGIAAEGVQRSHTLAVDAVEVPAPSFVPIRHRRADMLRDAGRHAPRRRELRCAEPRLRPGRQRLVEPRVACLVVSDERVEPLVRRLVIDDQPRERAVSADERQHRVFDPRGRLVRREHERVRAPRITSVTLGEEA